MFDGGNQLLEDVASFLDDVRQPVETSPRFCGVSFLEIMQTILLELLLFPGRSDHVHLGPPFVRIVVTIEADHWTGPVIDLAFQQMGGCLNLTALVSPFDRTDHSALLLDFTKFFQDPFLDGVTDHFHPR